MNQLATNNLANKTEPQTTKDEESDDELSLAESVRQEELIKRYVSLNSECENLIKKIKIRKANSKKYL